MQRTNYVAGLQAGDPACMKIVMEKTRDRLITHALRFTNDKEEIDDIVMRAYKELWIKHDKIRTENDLNALLFVAVESACKNYYKQLQRRASHHQQLLYTQKFQEASPAEKLEIKNLLEYVFSHFDELEPRCKDVLRLTYIEKLSDEEISERLNINKKAVQAKRSEGIARLKQMLNDKGAGPHIPILLLLLLFPGNWHFN